MSRRWWVGKVEVALGCSDAHPATLGLGDADEP
jgi:hypothetical protein